MDATSTYARPRSGRGGSFLHRFANPGRFLRLSARLQPWLTVAALVLTLCGLTWGLLFSPADWQQGDAVRIMYVLVLFFLYLGHVALLRAFDEPQRGYRAAAILALVGAVDLPIIKFSVQWWNTLHQPASITLTGAPTMSMSMLWPLLVSTLGFSFGFAAIVMARLRASVMEQRLRAMLLARSIRSVG